ncbi:MAG: ion transporter [Xanthomonadales bacterium]|nr:ion transporter [Xanthomonadales bacterium]
MSSVTIQQPALPEDAPAQRGLRRLLESRGFTAFITTVIVVNAITLGLETWPAAVAATGSLLYVIDRAALWIFTLEITLKLWSYRKQFFSDGWNWFDAIIVGLAWLPASGPLAVLRALRVLRVLRLLSVVPQMRTVVGALFSALPGMGAIVSVLLLVFYVAAVMATKLFGAAFPEWFGSVGESMYTLFQIMTLESWSMGIVRPVMESYPLAWVFFVPFVVVTSFAVLNLFIALIVNSMQTLTAGNREEAQAAESLAHFERDALMAELQGVRQELVELRRSIHGKSDTGS